MSSIFMLSSCGENEVLSGYEGEWLLISTSGGFHGGGIEVEWQSIKIQDSRFEVFLDDDLILDADLTYDGVIEGDSEPVTFVFDFVADLPQIKAIDFSENKYFKIDKSDQLIINDECCDLYTYVFERK